MMMGSCSQSQGHISKQTLPVHWADSLAQTVHTKTGIKCSFGSELYITEINVNLTLYLYWAFGLTHALKWCECLNTRALLLRLADVSIGVFATVIDWP